MFLYMYDYFPYQNVVLKSVTAEASGAVLGLSNLSKQHARQLISSHFTTQFTVSLISQNRELKIGAKFKFGAKFTMQSLLTEAVLWRLRL